MNEAQDIRDMALRARHGTRKRRALMAAADALEHYHELRRIALDVVLLDGEQDEAPSLDDMARRAKQALGRED